MGALAARRETIKREVDAIALQLNAAQCRPIDRRMASPRYLYRDDAQGRSCGPFTVAELKDKFDDGVIDGLTLVRVADGADGAGNNSWKSLAEYPELKDAFVRTSAVDDDEDDDDQEGESGTAIVASSSSSSSTAPAAVFFYEDNGKQQGPLTVDALRSMIEAGYVLPSTLVWRPGLSAWTAAKDVPDLGASSSSASSSSSSSLDSGVGQKRSRAEMEGGSGEGAGGPQAMTEGTKQKKKNRQKKKRDNNRPNGGDAYHWVTVTGLTPDITAADLQEHFKKAGVMAIDLVTGQPKIRLLSSSSQAHICFLKEASVELAVTLLDGVEIKLGVKLTVEPAEEDPEAGATGSGAGSVSKGNNHGHFSKEEIAQAKAREAQQRAALSWAEEGNEEIGIRTVVLRNVFSPTEFVPGYQGQTAQEAKESLEELEEDMATEAVRYGEVEKLIVYSRHPEGVVTVKFVSSGAAADCLSALNGRFFGGRKIAASFHDGVTDFRPPEAKRQLGGQKKESDDDNEEDGKEERARPAAAKRMRTSRGQDDDGEEQDEEKRLDAFGAYLEGEGK